MDMDTDTKLCLIEANVTGSVPGQYGNPMHRCDAVNIWQQSWQHLQVHVCLQLLLLFLVRRHQHCMLVLAAIIADHSMPGEKTR